jgi:AcrR family transcriptional regulator
MPRDREVTRARLLAAAERIIAHDGVGAARINAIAQAAGVDKVLIYRYFGGRAQLLRTLAHERRLWPSAETEQPAAPTSLAAYLTALLLAQARQLRHHPIARRCAAWELTQDDEFTHEFASAREASARAIVATIRARYPLPRFVDLEATVSLLTAASAFLALYAGNGSPFAGLEPSRNEHWMRAERSLTQLVHALLATPDE